MQTTNFIKLWVHEADTLAPSATHMATVVVLDRDLFRSLEVCVTLLQKAGWVVDDLAEYRIVPPGEEEPTSELITTARTEGFAYSLDPAPAGMEPPPAKQDFGGTESPGVTNLLGI